MREKNCLTQSSPLWITALEDARPDVVAAIINLCALRQIPIKEFIEEAVWQKLEREQETSPELIQAVKQCLTKDN